MRHNQQKPLPRFVTVVSFFTHRLILRTTFSPLCEQYIDVDERTEVEKRKRDLFCSRHLFREQIVTFTFTNAYTNIKSNRSFRVLLCWSHKWPLCYFLTMTRFQHLYSHRESIHPSSAWLKGHVEWYDKLKTLLVTLLLASFICQISLWVLYLNLLLLWRIVSRMIWECQDHSKPFQSVVVETSSYSPHSQAFLLRSSCSRLHVCQWQHWLC